MEVGEYKPPGTGSYAVLGISIPHIIIFPPFLLPSLPPSLPPFSNRKP